jgi:hypothetical protein
MNRRDAIKSILCLGLLSKKATSALPIFEPAPVKDTDPRWDWWNELKWVRERNAHLIGPDERFLTPDDLLQNGDFYFGNPPERWEFRGPKSSVGIFGEPMPNYVYCYAPAGKKERCASC